MLHLTWVYNIESVCTRDSVCYHFFLAYRRTETSYEEVRLGERCFFKSCVPRTTGEYSLQTVQYKVVLGSALCKLCSTR